jgi:molybdate transport system substrate-binding protein
MRVRRARMGMAACCLAIVAMLAAACGTSSSSTVRTTSASQKVSGTVVVFAAASLKDAFDQIGKQFQQANPGVSVTFNYAGSSSLATQIKQAAPADVFASADTTNMDSVTNDNLAYGSPKNFAGNTLEIMVAAGNPKHIKSVADLANPDVKVVVCASDVPCGKYTQEVFKKAGVTVQPVSEETSVSPVVTKVTLGEADAGVVYATDVKAGGDKIAGVAIPASQNVTAEYPIVALKDAPNKDGATAFINYVLGSAGQKVLESFGFLPAGK